MSESKIKVLVTGAQGDEWYDNSPLFKIYSGEEHDVWKAIADKHSYGARTDDSIVNIVHTIAASNGDGCDYINAHIITDKGLVTTPINTQAQETGVCVPTINV